MSLRACGPPRQSTALRACRAPPACGVDVPHLHGDAEGLTSGPAKNMPVTPPEKPVPLMQYMKIDPPWQFVPCQVNYFENWEYRHSLLYHFGKFSTTAGEGITE